MLLCACAHGVKSEISLDTSDSASNAVVKRSVLFLLTSVVQNVCVCMLWTSCLRAKKHYYYMWPFAIKLYHGWNKHDDVIEWNFMKITPPSKWRAGCAPDLDQALVFCKNSTIGCRWFNSLISEFGNSFFVSFRVFVRFRWVEVQGAKMIDCWWLTWVLEAGSTDVQIAWLLWLRVFKCHAQAHSSDNTGRFRESDHTIRNSRF